MGFASYARWARCRGAHLSMWSRQMNEAAFGSQRRGAAAAVLRAACSEVRPALSFPEQSNVSAGLSSVMGSGLEGVEPDSDEDGLSEVLDQILNGHSSSPCCMDLIEVQSGFNYISTIMAPKHGQ
mmetsp:Transcript_23015/g.48963  ORF Transcript_23015/g.48963 Transcript_23015/m.48963 type:complete len:125 (-) Transcript_23015:81-455(-)